MVGVAACAAHTRPRHVVRAAARRAAFGCIVGCAWSALRGFGQVIGHAPVGREEENRRRRRHRPGRDRGALRIARSATVGALPRHPVIASLLTMVVAGADDRSRLKPNRPTGTRPTCLPIRSQGA
jgi:hypothetical protein